MERELGSAPAEMPHTFVAGAAMRCRECGKEPEHLLHHTPTAAEQAGEQARLVTEKGS